MRIANRAGVAATKASTRSRTRAQSDRASTGLVRILTPSRSVARHASWYSPRPLGTLSAWPTSSTCSPTARGASSSRTLSVARRSRRASSAWASSSASSGSASRPSRSTSRCCASTVSSRCAKTASTATTASTRRPLEEVEDWLAPFLERDFDGAATDADGASTVFAAWSGADVGDRSAARAAETAHARPGRDRGRAEKLQGAREASSRDKLPKRSQRATPGHRVTSSPIRVTD